MDIYKNNQLLADLPVSEAIEFRDWKPPNEEFEENHSREPKAKTSKSGYKEIVFLKAVEREEGHTAAHYSAQIKVSPNTGTKIRDKLVKMKLIKTIATSKGKGRPPIILYLTQLGKSKVYSE